MKKILNITTKVAVLGMLLSLTSCYYDEVYEYTPPVAIEISFATDIQPIFTESCVACHGGAIEPDLTSGNAYASLTDIPGGIVAGDAEGSELVEMLEHAPSADSPMPPSAPIATSKINLIKAWINQGAKNN